MAGFSLVTFGGKAPKTFARLLPETMAQVATNCRLDSGRLEPWKSNLPVSLAGALSGSISSATRTLYKYSPSLWIASSEDVDIVRSPIAEDPWERIYLSGIGGATGYPRMTTAALAGNQTYYRLGLPEPASIVSVALSTTEVEEAEVPQTRSYIFTYVSAYGEEGVSNVPLVSNIVEVYTDQVATITFPSAPAGAYNITKRRLYRTDSSGVYRQVADIGIASATHDDSLSENLLGEEIPTSALAAPPDEVTADHIDGPLKGLISVSNGILAGFTGQTVCFSEAFLPHGFPEEYRLTTKYDIVAIAPLTSGILILTKGKPAMIQGFDPASMSITEIDSTLSCSSKRSVVDMGEYVVYSSPDGLVMASESGLTLMTQDLINRDQWQALNPSSILGFHYEGHYVGFYDTGSETGGFIIDPRGGTNSFVSLNFHATAGHSDLESDKLFLVVGGSLVEFATGSSSSLTWRTKKFYVQRPINVGVAKLECESYSPAPTFKLYADGVLKHTQTVTSANAFRLPAGYKANEFEIELSSSVAVNNVCVYESSEEING